MHASLNLLGCLNRLGASRYGESRRSRGEGEGLSILPISWMVELLAPAVALGEGGKTRLYEKGSFEGHGRAKNRAEQDPG